METEKTRFGNLNSIGVDDDPYGNVVLRNGSEAENRRFRVGDLVWVKIKSSPWWPGQVYDPRDASEFAVKHGLKDRILVVFFGDGSCSWSLPSQLRHFVENFKEMSVDAYSTSQSLARAIQSAIDEFSRVVESKLTCKCIPLESRDAHARPFVSNAGVKEGVLAPEVDIDGSTIRDYKPNEIISQVMGFARGVSIKNELEFSVLRSWIFAFYRAKGGYLYRLPIWYEPLCIEGMEDENKVSNDFSFPIEVPIMGSKSRVSLGDEIYQGKKRKSIAELTRPKVTTKEVVNGENVAEKTEEEIEKLSTPRERKKSKYLCPPYTSPKWRGSKRDKVSTVLVSESSDDEFDEMLCDDHLKGLRASVKVKNTTPPVKIEKKMMYDESDVDVPVDKLLSEIESAAVDSVYLSKEGSLDVVWAFASAFRSLTYLHGSDYKVFQKCKTGRKRKSFVLGNRENESDLKTPEAVKKPGSSMSKKAAEMSVGRNKLDGTASSCVTLTFSPEFPLPSKEETMRLFGKFGVLNEKETNVATDSHSVRIVYVKNFDAESAFKSSISQRPFGFENVVNCSLEYSVAGSDPKFPSCKKTPKKRGISHSTANVFSLDVRAIRQKLDTMMEILENQQPKFSLDDESTLKDAMKSLLENVERVSEQVMAKNSST